MSDMNTAVRSQAVALSDSGAAMLARLGLGLFLAIFVTTALLWTMRSLIDTGDDTIDPAPPIRLLEFVRVKRTPDPVPVRPIDPPIKPQPPPDMPSMDSLDPAATTAVAIPAPLTPPKPTIKLGPTGFNTTEGDVLPLMTVTPIYPQRAQQRGIEGYCTVRFTVTRQGTVRDPVIVRDQCSNSAFDRSSIDAALKSKYKPRIIDGQAVEVRDWQIRFRFEMDR